MGYARGAFTSLISSTSTQRPETFYSSVPTYEQYLRQKTVYREKAHSHNPCHDDWSTLTWLQVIPMEQRGDAATETTSVLSTKTLRAALCQRRRALHHCGDPDRSQTTGLTFVASLNFLNQIGIGMYDFTALSPFHAKLLACVQPIKAATTRHG